MKAFGGNDDDAGPDVEQTDDGGYTIIGTTWSFGAGWSDVWLIRFDTFGNKRWEKTFGGTDSDWGSSVHQTNNGGYIIVGSTQSYGTRGYDIWLIKLSQ